MVVYSFKKIETVPTASVSLRPNSTLPCRISLEPGPRD